jgi:hypothetical protein
MTRPTTALSGPAPAVLQGHVRVQSTLWLLSGAALLLGVIALRAPHGTAQRGRSAAADALLAVHDADPLELARVAARVGDDAVLALLAPEHGVAVRLAAVRTARWLREPERALAAIAELAGGRDSELAPAAARAALRIARALDAEALARREVPPTALSAALAVLLRVAKLPHVREDLQRMAGAAAAQLSAAGVPAPSVQ